VSINGVHPLIVINDFDGINSLPLENGEAFLYHSGIKFLDGKGPLDISIFSSNENFIILLMGILALLII
jgi:hypothetical protein